MNWLDWLLVALGAVAAVRGFLHGFVVEVASLVGVVAGIWVASRYNASVAGWLGLDPENEAISFVVAFIGMLLLVMLAAKVITKAMDLAMLSLPNKVAGAFFGVVRTLFIVSVVLNLLISKAGPGGLLSSPTIRGSVLFPPLRAVAPLLVPAFGDSHWVQQAMDRLKSGLDNADPAQPPSGAKE